MEHLPLPVHLLFVASLLLTIFFFYRATDRSKRVLLIIFSWTLLQVVIGSTGFYKKAAGLPPRFVLLVLPPIIFISVLFLTGKGRAWLDKLNIQWLTLLHVVRIPVEIVLFLLFVHKGIPALMTFEGRNFDVFSGISAPIVYYFVFVKGRWRQQILLGWNLVCLVLLANIVVHAILSAPTRFQQFGFDQPNIAILYIPFVLLPAVLVPLVLLAHLAAIRQLVNNKNKPVAK